MTSELKICPLAKSLLVAADEVAACGGGNEAEIMRVAAKKLTELNSRTVPDVPELVRYECELIGDFIDSYGMAEHSDGDYVRYDQASAMLAAKNEEIERLKNHLDDRKAYIFYLAAEVKAQKVKNKLLRDALETLVDRISYYASLAEEGIPNIEDWAYTDNSGDIAKARAALEGVGRG